MSQEENFLSRDANVDTITAMESFDTGNVEDAPIVACINQRNRNGPAEITFLPWLSELLEGPFTGPLHTRQTTI